MIFYHPMKISSEHERGVIFKKQKNEIHFFEDEKKSSKISVVSSVPKDPAKLRVILWFKENWWVWGKGVVDEDIREIEKDRSLCWIGGDEGMRSKQNWWVWEMRDEGGEKKRKKKKNRESK